MLEHALACSRETKRVEFKSEISPLEPGAWIEIVKDVVAIANSGGGVIVLGVDNFGNPTGWDPRPVLGEDPAKFVDRVFKFTGEEFDDVDVCGAVKDGCQLAAILIGRRTGWPLVFEKPGAYKDLNGVDKYAFAQGTVYFRHGAKSAPGNSRDFARFAADEEDRIRREILRGVRKVTTAPSGSEFIVARKGAPVRLSDRVRIVEDLDAPAVARTNFDKTHPHRRKELVQRVNELIGSVVVNGHDIQCIRGALATDDISKWIHLPKFSSPQYSEDFALWIADNIRGNSQFVQNAREAAKKN